MWRTLTLSGIMFFALPTLAVEPQKSRASGTQAPTTTDGLPQVIAERIKRIESKQRPKPRTWSGEEAEELIAKPEFTQVREMAMEKGLKFHRRIADDMSLDQKERAAFLSILANAHEARLEAVVYTLKQGSDYPRQLLKLVRAGKLPPALKKSDPTITRRKLLKLLGEERFGAYLNAHDKASALLRTGGVK